MARKVTAAQVAQAAGVSTAAVSRAFRPGSPLADTTRAAVLAAAGRLGYASPTARALALMTTGTITLVAGDMENPFYPLAAAALSAAIHARGQRMILHVVPPGGDVDTLLGQVLDYPTDGVIVTSALMSSRLARECRQRRVPVVLFNRVQPDQAMTAVTCDNHGGGRLVAQRLLAAGRRRLVLIGGRADTSTHLERKRGFLDTLRASGLEPVAQLSGGFSHAASFAAVSGLLASGAAVDGIFGLNDVMALAAIDAARTLGLRVPQDLAVIGFDDIAMAAWPSYDLTTVRQPLARMVADALALLDAQRADQAQTGVIRVSPVEMVERGSG